MANDKKKDNDTKTTSKASTSVDKKITKNTTTSTGTKKQVKKGMKIIHIHNHYDGKKVLKTNKEPKTSRNWVTQVPSGGLRFGKPRTFRSLEIQTDEMPPVDLDTTSCTLITQYFKFRSFLPDTMRLLEMFIYSENPNNDTKEKLKNHFGSTFGSKINFENDLTNGNFTFEYIIWRALFSHLIQVGRITGLENIHNADFTKIFTERFFETGELITMFFIENQSNNQT